MCRQSSLMMNPTGFLIESIARCQVSLCALAILGSDFPRTANFLLSAGLANIPYNPRVYIKRLGAIALQQCLQLFLDTVA